MKVQKVLFFASYLILSPLSEVQAQVINFVEGQVYGTLAEATLGWAFTVNETQTYNYLGIWDETADGLEIPHEIGLWDSSENLLATTTIASGTDSIAAFPTTEPEGIFRWERIAPVTLTPGETYHLGAFYCTSDFCMPGGEYIGVDSWVSDATASFDPNIDSQDSTFISARVLSFPPIGSIAGLSEQGNFGPNIAAAIPEPLTILGSMSTLLTMSYYRKTSRMKPKAKSNPLTK
ncbi:hypothetical protein [Gloeocapsa sp. PCC 73106]|uniref:hypothetical protein n=1 Tax=Gloeocapsa sp. PCC 73106 TaxID=102232 RepID=UPI0002AC6864|nr:hypothetical protein [Gloeocapsa sp. PCC 73106]ELR98776.1 hypothetical protein GLO73106DRAFT_00026140 [Gloeocapsa sp. PCC 73106]